LEREAYDMYGLLFINHPSLRRILTDYGTTFFPLRKSYSTIGGDEVLYNPLLRSISYQPLQQISEERALRASTPFLPFIPEFISIPFISTPFISNLLEFSTPLLYYPIEFTSYSLFFIDFYKEFFFLLSFIAFFAGILTILLLVSYLLATFLRGVDLLSGR
jgi:hypothetical protein